MLSAFARKLMGRSRDSLMSPAGRDNAQERGSPTIQPWVDTHTRLHQITAGKRERESIGERV